VRNRQRGVTFIGWVFLLIPVAIVVYAGIRLTPVILNYVKVARVLEQVASELGGDDGLTPQLIRSSIERRFDIDYIDSPKPGDIAIRRVGKGWVLEARYEDVAPLVANASILLEWDKSVTIE